MDQVIIYQTAQGGCAVMVPTAKALARYSAQELARTTLPTGTTWQVIPRQQLPADRTFRCAWRMDAAAATVVVDIDKARRHKMAQLRHLRDQKLQQLDIETLKGNDVQTQKQQLRDLPQNCDLGTIDCLQALKAFMPDILRVS